MLSVLLGCQSTDWNQSNTYRSVRNSRASFKQQSLSSRKRVLIVDDEPDHRLILRTVLEGQGYDCLEADSGSKALDQLADERVDVVVSDLQMPNMDGVELLQAMAQDQRLSQVPVIMTTSRTLDQELGLASKKPYEVFTKPFQIKPILTAVSCAMKSYSPK